MKLLLVTNDFPPRVGGIQTYLGSIYRRLRARGVDVRVLAPAFAGDTAFDRDAGMEVVRRAGSIWWSGRDLRTQIRAVASDADVVAFGAMLPMNLAARDIDLPVVVHTYGFEVGWARLPGPRSILRRIARDAALITTLSDYTGAVIAPVVGARTLVRKLPTGVELEAFTPSVDPGPVRARHGLGDAPVVVCVSRLVPRKGQDQLIRAMPAVRREIPDARALIVGGGSIRARLEGLAREHGVADAVTFAGEVSGDDLPAHYAAGNVFAMPARSRLAGLEVEGLGIVYLEAQACARPAITGDSGGAPEAVIDGETGIVVPGRDTRRLARALIDLLGDPGRARAMGTAGRSFVERIHDWDRIADDYVAMLRGL